MLKEFPYNLLKDYIQKYRPLDLSGTWHTVIGGLLNRPLNPKFIYRLVPLQDGDFLTLLHRPFLNDDRRLACVLIPGMGGNERSGYMRRITAKLERRSAHIFRLNTRGSGVGAGYARNIHVNNAYQDVIYAIESLRDQGYKKIIVIGFSMGGSLVSHVAAEYQKPDVYFFAFSPPIHFPSIAQLFASKKLYIFKIYFIRKMMTYARMRHEKGKDFLNIYPKLQKARIKSIADFDRLFTLQYTKKKNTNDYYKEISLTNRLKFLRNITIIYSKDDPIIDTETLKNVASDAKRNFHIFATERGGHMGMLSFRGIRFLDGICLKILQMSELIDAKSSLSIQSNRVEQHH